jgi:ADP-ribose pyrophosphatase YjhB (NUDIX family)
MSAATSRSRVTARLTQLRDAYEGFEVTQTTLSADSDAFDRVCGSEDGFTTVNVVIPDGDGGWLLVRNGDGWAYPGTVVGTGQPIVQTVERAVESTTGVEVTIEGIERVAIVCINCADDPEVDPVYQLKVVMSARAAEGTPTGTAAWRADPPVESFQVS